MVIFIMFSILTKYTLCCVVHTVAVVVEKGEAVGRKSDLEMCGDEAAPGIDQAAVTLPLAHGWQ